MNIPVIFDLHCDTVLYTYTKKQRLKGREGHLNLEKLRSMGTPVQAFALYLATHDYAERFGITEAPRELFNSMYLNFVGEIDANRDEISQVRCYEDIRRNIEGGKVSALLTLEDSALLNGELEYIDELYRKGVRIASLIWNYENSLGYPNSFNGELHGKGLKKFGFETVERMNELGIIVDVSHLNEGGFYDVADQSKKPFIASHSCARALCDHSRNLTDDQLCALGEHGGVCGVNFFSRFLVKDSTHTTAADIVRHMDYIRDKAGMEAVALGSDFDSIDCSLDFNDYSGLPLLIDEMTKCFTSREIELICSGNALRVFKDCVG